MLVKAFSCVCYRFWICEFWVLEMLWETSGFILPARCFNSQIMWIILIVKIEWFFCIKVCFILMRWNNQGSAEEISGVAGFLQRGTYGGYADHQLKSPGDARRKGRWAKENKGDLETEIRLHQLATSVGYFGLFSCLRDMENCKKYGQWRQYSMIKTSGYAWKCLVIVSWPFFFQLLSRLAF